MKSLKEEIERWKGRDDGEGGTEEEGGRRRGGGIFRSSGPKGIFIKDERILVNSMNQLI